MSILRRTLLLGAVAGIAACSDQTSPADVSAAISSTSSSTIVVTPSSGSLAPGATMQLTANVRRRTLSQTAFRWSTSNAAVASVSASGLVTAVGAGSANITARWYGYKSVVVITVTGAGTTPPTVDNTPSLTASTFTATPEAITVGNSSAFVITPLNAAGKKIGPNLVVTLAKTGGTATDVLSAVTYNSADSTYRAKLTAGAVGTPITVTAGIGGAALPVSKVITVTAGSVVVVPPVNTTSWTFCTNVGAPCDYIGLRDVRLVSAAGTYVAQERFGFIPCAQYGFAAQLSGSGVRCEYGPLKTQTFANPAPGAAGTPATFTVALGDPGFTTQRSSNNGGTSSTPGEGSFRTICNLTKIAVMDPIVYPGQANTGHLHMFFGNAGVSPSSTVEQLANSGGSTCLGGTLNRSAYWAPAIFDASTGEVQTPRYGVFYYKSGYNLDPTLTQPVPAGLRMIAGDKNATGPQNGAPYYAVSWACELNYVTGDDGLIPNCPVGDAVQLRLQFPQCWNGRDLDSPDHKSHMAYANYRNPPQRTTCPATHPVQLPSITQIYTFPVYAGSQPMRWRLASDTYSSSIRGGLSAHGDWMDGWSRDAMTTFVKNCINGQKDCGVGSLGDGRLLTYQDR